MDTRGVGTLSRNLLTLLERSDFDGPTSAFLRSLSRRCGGSGLFSLESLDATGGPLLQAELLAGGPLLHTEVFAAEVLAAVVLAGGPLFHAEAFGTGGALTPEEDFWEAVPLAVEPA